MRPNRDTFGFKPISISILSAIAKKQKWTVKLFDTTNLDLGEFGYDSRKVAEASKLFKPVDFSQYNLKKEKIDLKEKIIKDIIENYFFPSSRNPFMIILRSLRSL